MRILLKSVTFFVVFMVSGCGSDKPVVLITEGCNVDSMEGFIEPSPLKYVSKQGSSVSFIGWMADIKNNKVPDKVSVNIVSLNGNAFNLGVTSSKINRPDVANANHMDKIVESGFKVSSNLDIPVGSYNVQLLGNYSDKTVLCPQLKELVVE